MACFGQSFTKLYTHDRMDGKENGIKKQLTNHQPYLEKKRETK